MIRRVLVAAVLGAAGLVPFVAAASPANAIPICKGGFTCLYVYYSSPAHTTAIGYFSIPCSGPGSSSGTTSGYFTFSEAQCNS